MEKGIFLVTLTIGLAIYVFWDYNQNRFTKQRLIDRADVIAVVKINSINCPADRSCKGYTMSTTPIFSVKGTYTPGASIFMKKG